MERDKKENSKKPTSNESKTEAPSTSIAKLKIGAVFMNYNHGPKEEIQTASTSTQITTEDKIEERIAISKIEIAAVKNFYREELRSFDEFEKEFVAALKITIINEMELRKLYYKSLTDNVSNKEYQDHLKLSLKGYRSFNLKMNSKHQKLFEAARKLLWKKDGQKSLQEFEKEADENETIDANKLHSMQEFQNFTDEQDKTTANKLGDKTNAKNSDYMVFKQREIEKNSAIDSNDVTPTYFKKQEETRSQKIKEQKITLDNKQKCAKKVSNNVCSSNEKTTVESKVESFQVQTKIKMSDKDIDHKEMATSIKKDCNVNEESQDLQKNKEIPVAKAKSIISVEEIENFYFGKEFLTANMKTKYYEENRIPTDSVDKSVIANVKTAEPNDEPKEERKEEKVIYFDFFLNENRRVISHSNDMHDYRIGNDNKTKENHDVQFDFQDENINVSFIGNQVRVSTKKNEIDIVIRKLNPVNVIDADTQTDTLQ